MKKPLAFEAPSSPDRPSFLRFGIRGVRPRFEVVIACLFSLNLMGCTRKVHITEQMTWERAPDEFKPAFYAKPDEYVRFRYVKNPHCFEVASAKNLGDDLSTAGRAIVSVEFEVWGEHHQVRGIRPLAVDGRELQDDGGWSSGGSNDNNGACPLDSDF
jgi:hypothetical protein